MWVEKWSSACCLPSVFFSSNTRLFWRYVPCMVTPSNASLMKLVFCENCKSSFVTRLSWSTQKELKPLGQCKRLGQKVSSLDSVHVFLYLRCNPYSAFNSASNGQGETRITLSSATCEEMCHIRLSLKNFMPYGPRSSDRALISEGKKEMHPWLFKLIILSLTYFAVLSPTHLNSNLYLKSSGQVTVCNIRS